MPLQGLQVEVTAGAGAGAGAAVALATRKVTTLSASVWSVSYGRRSVGAVH